MRYREGGSLDTGNVQDRRGGGGRAAAIGGGGLGAVGLIVLLIAFVLALFFKVPPLRQRSALQEQADHAASKDELEVAAGGAAVQCGWITDPYGYSWQITPRILNDALADKDRKVARAAFEAMMPMVKIDVAAIEAAIERARAHA